MSSASDSTNMFQTATDHVSYLLESCLPNSTLAWIKHRFITARY